MKDDFDTLLESYLPNILEDQFSQYCYEIYIENEKGRVLFAHMYDEYVNKPFTNIMDINPKIEKDQILFKSAWRDLIQRLLLRGQSYEKALKTKGDKK